MKTRIMPYKPIGIDNTYWMVEVYRRSMFGYNTWFCVGKYNNYTAAEVVAKKCKELDDEGGVK